MKYIKRLLANVLLTVNLFMFISITPLISSNTNPGAIISLCSYTSITNKSYKIFEINNGILSFYKFKINSDNNVYPVLDQSGSQVILNPSTKSFYEDVKLIFQSDNYFYVDKENIYVVGLLKIENASFGFCRYFNNLENPNTYEVGTRNLDKKIYDMFKINNNISFFIMDAHYNIDIFEIKEKSIKNLKTFCLNPDLSTNIFNTIALRDLIPSRYSLKNEAGKGYLWLQKDNRTFYANGQQSSNNYKPFIHNGSLAVDLFWFAHVMNGGYSWDVEKKVRLLRLYDPQTGDPQLVDIQLTIGEKKAIVDGQEYELAFAPFLYDNKSVIYAPLKDICFLFNAKMIWRSFDNSVLIERFNPYHKRPDLPKKSNGE